MANEDALTRRDFMKTAAAAGLATAALASAQTRRIKVGVIGCGSVSGSYLPVMVASPHIELVSACDLIIQRADDQSRKFGIPDVHPHIYAMLKGPKFAWQRASRRS